MIVDDVHSRLNPTDVAEVVEVESADALRTAIERARDRGRPVSVAGGRHAMGGQQFVTGGTLIDTRPMSRVLSFDRERGLVEAEAGLHWPELIQYLIPAQDGMDRQWGIRQKQTGADRLTLGGSVSANSHGRGLAFPPLVADVERLTVVRPDGSLVVCSRDENADLFGLVVGGYGLLGAIYSVTLRLGPRQKLERVVEVVEIDDLMRAFERRIADGFLYGDFQFAIDPDSDDFLRGGVFSCYAPVDPDTPIPADQRALVREDWQLLLWLAHTDKRRAFDDYARHYLATSGQVYWSDLHQLADYVDGYHETLDARAGSPFPATEMISELYVPRERLADFMAAVADDFRRNGVDVIYGTIRLIERDVDTYLAWAREPFACVIFNLHTVHSQEGIAHSAEAFRRLIDLAIDRGGSFFLTYHRWATAEQVEACYPQFGDFLELKRAHDPDGTFQSDWYRHYAALIASGRRTP
jgi:FAD/FMN-containing dehydrogenase